jgi:hypothetical protein
VRAGETHGGIQEIIANGTAEAGLEVTELLSRRFNGLLQSHVARPKEKYNLQ